MFGVVKDEVDRVGANFTKKEDGDLDVTTDVPHCGTRKQGHNEHGDFDSQFDGAGSDGGVAKTKCRASSPDGDATGKL